ncbi:hypothetical protein BDF20DRAFT_875607 [Mycotypha africana]|uniref:uncharacterized protein n=1 Tax=Mycotypha africana TaxID=64632 RepID=UPI00230060C7|nr:uncharacterized protein BDF20DRAFT_875607 [Mycotypha africana]KAI8977577.1 hypothetical protein BDF20DRAFT_875607 [Mycotypha africana]
MAYLTKEHIQQFQEKGYTVLLDALTKEELALLHEESDVLLNHLLNEGYDIVKHLGCIVEPWTCGFLEYENEEYKTTAQSYKEIRDTILWDNAFPGSASDLILKKYGGFASQLLASQRVYLLNEQFIIKPPFTLGQSQFVWHKDSDYYDDVRHRKEWTVACWTALDDVGASNGTVELKDFQGGERMLEAPAGSILFMSSQLLHKSEGNGSAAFRRAFMTQFSTKPLLHYGRDHLPLAAQCVGLAVPCDTAS